MTKQIEFNVEYSPEHELAAEKAVPKSAGFEMTSESIKAAQHVCLAFFNLVYQENHFQKISFHQNDFDLFSTMDNNHSIHSLNDCH